MTDLEADAAAYHKDQADSLKERLRKKQIDNDTWAMDRPLFAEALARIEELEAEIKRHIREKREVTCSFMKAEEGRVELNVEIERLRSELNCLGQPFGDPAKS